MLHYKMNEMTYYKMNEMLPYKMNEMIPYKMNEMIQPRMNYRNENVGDNMKYMKNWTTDQWMDLKSVN